jgi:putative cofactor-binding repeat protein
MWTHKWGRYIEDIAAVNGNLGDKVVEGILRILV